MQGALAGILIFLIGEAWISKTIRDTHEEQIVTLMEICKNQNETNETQNNVIKKIIDLIK